MTTLGRIAAVLLGALLYLAEERLLGYLAAVTVPKAYFEFFGTHKVIALCVEEAVLMALPAWLLALGWGLATTRLVPLPPWRVAGWVVAGLVCAWFGRSLYGLIDAQSSASSFQDPFATLSLLVPPIWGVLTSLSAPLGLLVAGAIARRSDRPLPPTAARPLDSSMS